MTNQNPQPNNNPNNEEEWDMQRIYASLDRAKKSFDNYEDVHSCLSLLNLVKKNYDTELIPSFKKFYADNPSQREFLTARANQFYEIVEELYQHGLKKAESLGVKPLDPPFSLPKSLEKLAFPENN